MLFYFITDSASAFHHALESAALEPKILSSLLKSFWKPQRPGKTRPPNVSACVQQNIACLNDTFVFQKRSKLHGEDTPHWIIPLLITKLNYHGV